MCTASSHPVPQELTFFWKGTFDSTVDPAHQRRTNRGRVIEQEVWALEWTQDTDDHIQVYKQGQDWGKCKGEAAPNEPIIVVGTLTGNTRTLSVYRDSDMSVISTVANSDGPPLEAGIDKKICMGYAQWNYNALAPNALYDTAHWRGEFEKVVVYDKVLGEQEITQVVNSLHNPQASAAGGSAPGSANQAAASPWRDVLRYHDSYTPTTAAVGDMAGASAGFAKLSDTDINNIQGPGDGWNYYRLSTSDTSEPRVINPIYIRTHNTWVDTSVNIGWGRSYEICKESDFAQCDWQDPQLQGDASLDTFRWGNDCNRWFADYAGNVGHCFDDNYEVLNGKRCFNAGQGCGNHKRIKDVVIAKLEA